MDEADRYLFKDVETDPRVMFDPEAVTWVLSNVKTGDFAIRGPWPFARGAEQPWAMGEGLNGG